MRIDIRELARGRWPEILPMLGVEKGLLDGTHQACPFCGGKDRFRFTDFEESGMYICNHCGAGSGFDLVMNATSCTFTEAVREIRKLLNGDSAPARRKAIEDLGKSGRMAEKTWRESKELVAGDAVIDYLKGRGLTRASHSLRSAAVFDGQSAKSYTSMVAQILGPESEVLGIHVTHLAPDPDRAGLWCKAKIDNPKKQRKIAGTIKGGSIRLFSPGPSLELGLAEGIETAIAVREMFNIACWSVMNTSGMENFEMPGGRPSAIRIFADNDQNHAGMRAAYALANRLAVKDQYFNTFVERPIIIGDYLDELNAHHGLRPEVGEIK